MTKLLHIDWNPHEAISLSIDCEDKSPIPAKYQQVKERKEYFEYASINGTYKFYKNDGKVTLDTGVDVRDVKVCDWRVEVA